MLTKRLIACFDVKNGYVTKALQFQDNIDIGRAEEIACKVYEDQIDEIIFYDITASSDKRKIDGKESGKKCICSFYCRWRNQIIR